jgi:hypothetical protein
MIPTSHLFEVKNERSIFVLFNTKQELSFVFELGPSTFMYIGFDPSPSGFKSFKPNKSVKVSHFEIRHADLKHSPYYEQATKKGTCIIQGDLPKSKMIGRKNFDFIIKPSILPNVFRIYNKGNSAFVENIG